MAWGKEKVPQMTSVRDGPVAGDPLALPLVESMEFIGILANAPLFGTQIPPLIKLLPQVFPVSVGRLGDENRKSVRMAPCPPPALGLPAPNHGNQGRSGNAGLEGEAGGRILTNPSATRINRTMTITAATSQRATYSRCCPGTLTHLLSCHRHCI